MGARGGYQGGGTGHYNPAFNQQQGGGAPFNAPDGPRKRFKADDN
jgi:hypothetical protein